MWGVYSLLWDTMCVCVYIYTYISEFIRCDWDRITAVAIFSDSLPTYDSGFKVHLAYLLPTDLDRHVNLNVFCLSLLLFEGACFSEYFKLQWI